MPTLKAPADIAATETYADACERGKEAAWTLIREGRDKLSPIPFNLVAKRMIARGVFGGYEAGFFQAIWEATL